MLIVETISKIKRMHYVDKKGAKTIARELRLSKNTVKKVIRSKATKHEYKRHKQPYPVLSKYKDILEKKLSSDILEPKRRRRTAKKLYQELCELGYSGTYETVNNYVNRWKLKHGMPKNTQAYVPLEFDPGEAFQFDWSEEEIELSGKKVRVKAAQIRLCYSRLFLVVVFMKEQLEMVMEAHNIAFRFFNGCCKKGIYDNMKTAVQKILIGKDRKFNERFLELASHYLFEPVACTPSAGWEKGQVENQVSTSRNNFFSPLKRVNSLEELNQKLQEECTAWAKRAIHPEFKDKTVWEVYQEERKHLVKIQPEFEAYKLRPTTVSAYSLVQFETNSYSVNCAYVSRAVELNIYADKIVIKHKEKIIGEHIRCFERYKKIYNPWHYIPILEYKPGALRNGAPFKQLKLPKEVLKIKQEQEKYSDGDKKFIQLLLKANELGLDKLRKACMAALEYGVSDIQWIIDIMYGKHIVIDNGHIIKLTTLPQEDCQSYNQMLSRGDYYVV